MTDDYKDIYAEGLQVGMDLYKRQLEAVDMQLGFPDGSGRGRVEMIADLQTENQRLKQALKDLGQEAHILSVRLCNVAVSADDLRRMVKGE